jgi:hypothetical protein
MELNKREIAQLKKWGNNDEDIRIMAANVDKVKYETEKGRVISAESAKNILGWKNWLSGIDRVIFHASCERDNPKRHTNVSFSYKWWRD